MKLSRSFCQAALASGAIVPPLERKTHRMSRLEKYLWFLFLVAAALGLILLVFGSVTRAETPTPLQRDAAGRVIAKTVHPPSRPIRCWPVANGVNATTVCENGWWSTITADGTVVEGNGYIDPNAGITGSRIQIDPTTSRPTGVIPPESTVGTPGPGQWYYGGFPPPGN